ncbi:hypothetical protein Z517_03132 [Fonsecaea pedrosoi CBS 271.37]|uniref:GPR1/FUN34/YaaH-class plasma membrane protein n=1 Tax=Fonsecaea pedrosoi CBS 271.37 TaxID=1442368 RepID=A0A0D2E1G3_9EURO|nr:uncharacterized protein Z517_03132 [Fonsecaea pedrosoi CBS 271.37]KIW83886.1 hypothetical protein Z517_03132 [Fonsecaea pedrosoi CBS 271.37]
MEDNKVTPLNHLSSKEDFLRRVQTADSVFLPRDVFEALYLSPERNVPGDLRKKFGNPTPAALIGFVMSATPYAAANMGWRGAGGLGGALIPTMIFFGGILQILGAIGEWILGNTFSMCLFFTYGTFWIVAGTQLVPWFGVGVQYSTTGDNFHGMTEPAYFATVGFYYVSLAMITTIFAICALRTNIVFFSALFTLIFAFGCAAGAFWHLALGNADTGNKLTIAAGAFTWALTMMVWYLLAVQLLECVDFPLTLPVGDLSGFIKGKSERAAKKVAGSANDSGS